MAGFLENLWRHVAWSAAGGGQDVKLLLVHDPAEAKVGNQEVGVVFRGSEE